MLVSISFRWTYMTWTFFGVMTSASVFLALVAFILGIVCRINFGKGLVRCREFDLFVLLLLSCLYGCAVNAEEPLPDDFVPVNYGDDLEKIALPSEDRKAPTFSVAFDLGQEVLPPSPPSQKFAPGMWQTFSTHDGLPTAVGAVQVQPSSPSYNTVDRHPSNSSTHSSLSTSSGGRGHSKRWIIE